MNKLPREKRAHILALLCEGNSMRATSRIADVAFNSVVKLLIDAGRACSDYQDRAFRNLTKCERIQVDEIWAFCYAKQKNVPEGKEGVAGDIWTWTAICADTKLVPSWWVGSREGENARSLLVDLAGRVANRIQLTSDGLTAYRDAVADAFTDKVDYAMLVKTYGDASEGEKRYSPPVCTGARKTPITGNPDRKHISTSYVERQNLTMRMSIRRFTRLTNAFSKKVENHCHAVALHFMYYNFVRIHKTLKCSPAMAAGVTTKLWDVMDIVDVIEAWERQPAAIEPSENADLERLRGDSESYLPGPLRGINTIYGLRRIEEKNSN